MAWACGPRAREVGPVRERKLLRPFLALFWALGMQMSPRQAWALSARTCKPSGDRGLSPDSAGPEFL